MNDNDMADQRLDCCPRCGAKTEKDAETMCKPGVDECPMADEGPWDQRIRYLADLAEYDEQF